MQTMKNEASRSYEVRECRSCGDEAKLLVIKLREPEIVNKGTKWEWTRTEIVSKCVRCYF